MSLLYLDFDHARSPRRIEFITECCRRWEWPLQAIRFDRTERGWHVIVKVHRTVPPALIVAAQAIWGSDKRREHFNLMRVQNLHRVPKFWRSRFNVLYSQHSRDVQLLPAVKS
jgi:hypothetical protein